MHTLLQVPKPSTRHVSNCLSYVCYAFPLGKSRLLDYSQQGSPKKVVELIYLGSEARSQSSPNTYSSRLSHYSPLSVPTDPRPPTNI